MSKTEIARQMQVNPSTLQRWKNGETFPELPNIEKLAKILNVDEREFYESKTPVIREMPVSSALKRMAAIPDDIYEKAQAFGSEHEVWEEVRATFEDALKDIEEKKKARA